jgi:prefoldin subunit 5
MIPSIRNQQEPEETDMDAPEYFRAIGRLEAQVQALTTAVGELKTKLDGIDTRLDTLDRMANRWKGGFAVILTLGAIAGFIIDHVFRWIAFRSP